MDNKSYEVKLENVFEGPMDLLVYLIKKNEVDIYDIPIAIITEQYLLYISWMKSMNIDFAGEFLLLASTLTQIKSKMLLPIHKNDDREELEDPRMEIARPILEYLKLKYASEELAKLDKLGEDTFKRKSIKTNEEISMNEEIVHLDLYDLFSAFKTVYEKISSNNYFEFNFDVISIQDKISEITNILEEKSFIAFEELFTYNKDKNIIVVTFLAVLEMSKLNLIRIIQHIQNGIIRLVYL